MELSMKQHNFVKYNPGIDQITGSQQGTLILSALEFWFIKKPEGFYKFMEPCSHRLYKKGDSWLEEVGLVRKRFARAFEVFGIKYSSRSTFENAKDKFKGKLYASYYDRYTNRTFFIRNHDLANDTLKGYFKAKITYSKKTNESCKISTDSLHNKPLSTGHFGRSYKEAKNTSKNLSKDKYHADNDIVKKMIELWTALVEQGRGKIELTNRRIAFLKKALIDKFDGCLEKWKKYCQDIASSRFLMGEVKSSFSATLDWALKFDVIQKILEGCYGIGDRNQSFASSSSELYLKNSKTEIDSEVEEIRKITKEPEVVKEFRLKWLNKFGARNYREYLKDCGIKVRDDGELILCPSSRYNAKSIASYWSPTLFVDSPFTKANIFQQEGELVFDKWFEDAQSREGGLPQYEAHASKVVADSVFAPIAKALPETLLYVERSIENTSENIKMFTEADLIEKTNLSPETQMLRKKLKKIVPSQQFPSWLETIEVENIGQDGMIVVTLEDPLAVSWCRSHFSEEIFKSVKSLWKRVYRLHIREKLSHTLTDSVKQSSKNSKKIQENISLEQAIQSLLSAYSLPNGTVGGRDGICQIFC